MRRGFTDSAGPLLAATDPRWTARGHREAQIATVADILASVDRLAPFRLAEAWDNVGLLLGDARWEVRRVLVSLDLSETVLEEAERLEADCVLTHHPVIFKDVDRLTAETRHGRLALRLLAGRRALIAAHTNLDAAAGGLCDLLAEMVGIVDLAPLRDESEDAGYKVVVFVPEENLEGVRAAAFDAGAGRIGNYTECGFSVRGEGTFRPGDESHPAVGSPGRRNVVPERRLEVVADGRRLGAVVAAIARAHSYEAPAIDVYTLKSVPVGAGVGRAGRLKRAKTVAALADEVKQRLGLSAVGIGGDRGQRVERVALVTGSGGGLGNSVMAAGVQAFLTGELKFHEAQELEAAGIAVILGGHYETERVPLEAWVPRLADAVDAEVKLSESERGIISLG